ncbi:hypothetical protein [Streptosporangium canum]|uniref:hypothetical protein n=1 Tax=Streptosporangium canum TaxID=324952 RepID=UPI0037B12B0E
MDDNVADAEIRTGKPTLALGYAPRTIKHALTGDAARAAASPHGDCATVAGRLRAAACAPAVKEHCVLC